MESSWRQQATEIVRYEIGSRICEKNQLITTTARAQQQTAAAAASRCLLYTSDAADE